MQNETKDEDYMTYIPKACREGGEFSGSVILKRITMLDRYRKLPKLEELIQDGKKVEATIHAIESTMDLWVTVDITRKKTGQKFTSLNALMKEPKADQLIAEVAFGFLQGFPEDDEGNGQGEK